MTASAADATQRVAADRLRRTAFDDGRRRDANRARRLTWLGFWTMLVSIGIGLSWDAAWHTTRPFETVLSPPHLFVYVTTGLTAAVYVALLTTPRLRRAFGHGFSVPGVPFHVPGPLFTIGAGLGLLALGAVLDAVWHSAFGLDETRWSAPHAMLGWGWGLAAFGFVASRIALREHQPLRWWTRVFIGLVLLAFSIGPLLGPFQHNQTAAKVRAIASIPVLQEQPAYQHAARIYLDWQLVRANPLSVVLGALWFGVSLALLRAVDRQTGFVLLLVGVWTLSGLLRDRGTAIRLGLNPSDVACWLPMPLLPASLVSALCWRIERSDLAAAAAGGAVFGAMSQLIWPSVGLLTGAALGAPVAAVGFLAGVQLAATLTHPTARRCTVLAAVSLGAPLLSGVVDLVLRSRTPWS